MNRLTKFVNDVYQGLYYYALKYESVQEAKNNLRLRLIVTFFLYYFSLLLLLITVIINLYGTKKLGYLEGATILFGIYFVVYRYLIEGSIIACSFDDLPDERKRKVKLSLLVFWGSIASLAVTMGLISYFMPKR